MYNSKKKYIYIYQWTIHNNLKMEGMLLQNWKNLANIENYYFIICTNTHKIFNLSHSKGGPFIHFIS